MKIDINKAMSYYISLDRDVERRSAFLKWCEEYEIERLTKIPGILSDPYHLGLNLAHHNAISAGIKLNEPFVVFEDDAAPIYSYEETKKILVGLDIPEDADAVYLGLNNWGGFEVACHGDVPCNCPQLEEGTRVKATEKENVYRLINGLTTHAVVYFNNKYAQDVSDLFSKTQKYCDQALFYEGFFDKYNVYVVGPIFYQNDLKKPSVADSTKNLVLSKYLV